MAVFETTDGKTPLPHAGTYNGNPVTSVAGRTAMEMLTGEVFEQLNTLGGYARESMNEAFRAAGAPGRVSGAGSLFLLHLRDSPQGYRGQFATPELLERRIQLTHHFLNNGIMMNPLGLGAISTPMSRVEVDRLSEVLLTGLRALPAEPAPLP